MQLFAFHRVERNRMSYLCFINHISTYYKRPIYGKLSSFDKKKTYYISLAILAGMFFIFGFVSWVNSILIPYFRISCELTHFESYFVAFAFYIAYFVMAIPSGILLKKVGFKKGIMYGFMLTSLGAFIFVPAALARQFEIFLVGLFSIGTGLAILQTAANPYVTIIGPIDSAARRISIMGICNKIAGIISPLIFAALILKSNDSELFALIESGTLDEATKNAMLNELIQRVIVPYCILGVILLLTGIGIRYSVLPEINTDEQNATDGEENKHSDKKHIGFSLPYIGGFSYLFPCRHTSDSHRYNHQLCQFHGNGFIGSKSISLLYIGMYNDRIYNRYHPHPQIHFAEKRTDRMYPARITSFIGSSMGRL